MGRKARARPEPLTALCRRVSEDALASPLAPGSRPAVYAGGFTIGTSTSQHDTNLDANTWIERIKQVIPATDVVDVNVIGVIPAHRPRLNKSERVAAILEARVTADDHWLVDHKHVSFTKIATEPIVRYATAAGGTEPQCRHSALPLLVGRTPLRWLLRRPLIGLSLVYRFGLWLLSGWLSLLLLLRYWLSLLLLLSGWLGLLLVLRYWLSLLLLLRYWLGLLLLLSGWLGLLLFLRCWLSLLLFLRCWLGFLLVGRLLREGRNNGSEK